MYFALSGCSDPDDSQIAQSETGTGAIYGIHLLLPPPTQSSQRAKRAFTCFVAHHGQKNIATRKAFIFREFVGFTFERFLGIFALLLVGQRSLSYIEEGSKAS